MSELLRWIDAEIQPRMCSSAELVYDHMPSQSSFRLPFVYIDFDVDKRSHWIDRGYVLDFLAIAGNGRLLDFGPGDGWPSLPMARYVEHITGIDSSSRRVAVCNKNALKLGLKNCRFLPVEAGGRLPFENDTFDGITAASSVEQTPNPEETVRELYRVLKKGGRLRMTYEGLAQYRDGREIELSFFGAADTRTLLLIYDRHIERESVDWYCIDIEAGLGDISHYVGKPVSEILYSDFAPAHLLLLRDKIIDARKCTLSHPSGKTWTDMLIRTGFSFVHPSKSGADAARLLFDLTEPHDRPGTLRQVDKLLRPAVKRAVFSTASIEKDPVITAVK